MLESGQLMSTDSSVELLTPLVCCAGHDAAALPADTCQSEAVLKMCHT